MEHDKFFYQIFRHFFAGKALYLVTYLYQPVLYKGFIAYKNLSVFCSLLSDLLSLGGRENI